LPVWVVDHNGVVVLANPAAVAALGYDDPSELRGRHGHDTVHYKHPDGSPFPREECPLLAPMRTGAPVHCDEDWLVRRDGTMFPVSVTATAADLPTGRGVVMTFVDMTAQREAEQSLRERDAILAQVAQPVWVVDHEGRFHYANPAALAALGYDDPSDLVGKPGHDTVHYKYPDGTPFPEEECAVARARNTGRPTRSARTGSCARTARSSRSPTPRRRSSCPAGSAPSPPSPTSRTSSRRSESRASATSPRRGRRSSGPPAGA
jgi:PAS domain S-box-containing protein